VLTPIAAMAFLNGRTHFRQSYGATHHLDKNYYTATTINDAKLQTRKLSYRKDHRAMRPTCIYGCHLYSPPNCPMHVLLGVSGPWMAFGLRRAKVF